ncbi:MAG TPA: BatA domain-containing protein [Candidatus Acidoferrales bacterium]|nr:BatA domain-containing protein [Candidatus Acidoferrales bacterium]
MGFFTPWFLAGTLAVGLPVWLHLLRKHKTTPLPFGSLMFFEKRTQSSIKHRRLRYLLLFAARALLVLLLVLAFAHPYIRRQVLASKRTGEVTVLAIDNSMSMRAGNRLDQAKQAAKSVVGGLRTGQRAQVLAFGSRVQVMSEVTDDHQSLNAGIDAVASSDARTSYAELSRSLRSIATSLKLPLAVELYSDMQQTGWPANFNDLRLTGEIQLNPHGIEAKDMPNFTVENVVAPRRVYDAKKTRVLATVAGFCNKKAARTVSLLLNGRLIESKQVEVPEGGRASAEFLSMDVPYGRNKGEVRIDSGDSLPADDVFYFSIERADPRHAMFVQEAAGSRGLLYFRSALEASGQSAFEIDAVTVDQVANLNPSKYAFVVLNDLMTVPAQFENALREYVRGGGSVWVSLGVKSAGRSKVPVTGQAIGGGRYSGREGERFQAAAWLDPSHPSILKNDRWQDVKFYNTVRVTPGTARVVAKLSDQAPLLVDEQIGEGHVLVFGSTFDNLENDFPVHASFVPFVEQTARYLGRLDAGPASVLVGSFAELRDTKEKGAAVDVVDPKGDRALSLDEATKAQNIQFTAAGFYDIRRPNGRNELVAVNADRRESDLAPVSQESLSLWQNTAQGASSGPEGATGDQQRPVSLWWYVMLAVFLLAVAESLLGNQHLSVDKEAV